MGFYSAQLDENGIVMSVVDTTEKVEGSNIIDIQSVDVTLLGKKYNAGTQQFEEVPLTQEQLNEIAIKTEIERIKADANAALRAEAIANLTTSGKISVVTE